MGILPYCVERRMKKRYNMLYGSLEQYTHRLKKILNAEILHYFDINGEE
jgi:hypothetical protein